MYDDKNIIHIFYFTVVFNNLKLYKKKIFNSFLNNGYLTWNGSHGI